MNQFLAVVAPILFTIIIYLVMNRFYRRFPIPIFLPILTSTGLIIIILKISHISYDMYMTGGRWIDMFLGPAIVSLAHLLYQHRKVLLKNFAPILAGLLIGLVTGVITVLILMKLLAIPVNLLPSILPKSITTPVAMEISSALGGIPSLTVVFVMTAGITGAVLGPFALQLFRIDSLLGKGVAFGNASHVIGTSKAMEYGEYTASVSSVSMTLSAIIGSLLGFIISMIF